MSKTDAIENVEARAAGVGWSRKNMTEADGSGGVTRGDTAWIADGSDSRGAGGFFAVSGPAYIYMVIEALIAGGLKMRSSRGQAHSRKKRRP